MVDDGGTGDDDLELEVGIVGCFWELEDSDELYSDARYMICEACWDAMYSFDCRASK